MKLDWLKRNSRSGKKLPDILFDHIPKCGGTFSSGRNQETSIFYESSLLESLFALRTVYMNVSFVLASFLDSLKWSEMWSSGDYGS